jgi:hypothetical protein
LLSESNFASHPFARQAIMEAASTILDERFYSTSDQVENCIKPYKFEIDIEDREWAQGRENAGAVLKSELQDCEAALGSLESSVGGRRKLREVMSFVDKARKGDIVVEGDGRSGAGGFSASLLGKGEFTNLFQHMRSSLILSVDRARSGLPSRSGRYHQNAPHGCQVKTMRQLKEQVLLSGGVLERRSDEAGIHGRPVP